jgi:CspA family cold shock protein
MPTGTVKWFNPEKGYGFIQPDQAGGREVFVPLSALEQGGLKDLTEGQKVEFDLVEQERNGTTMAGNIRAL